jgi:hypothetical protein
MKLFTIIACWILLMLFSSLRAQVNDYGLWVKGGIEKDKGKWSFDAEGEIRTFDHFGTIDRWSLQSDVAYSVFKSLSIGAGYQFMSFNDTLYSDIQPRHRINIFVKGKKKLGNFTFSIRERIQVTRKDEKDRIKESGNTDNYRVNPEWTWRNLIKVAYNIPSFPVNPSISGETFVQLNKDQGTAFNRFRLILSLEYKLSKHHQFEVYGLTDREIYANNPARLNIIGFGYTFTF